MQKKMLITKWITSYKKKKNIKKVKELETLLSRSIEFYCEGNCEEACLNDTLLLEKFEGIKWWNGIENKTFFKNFTEYINAVKIFASFQKDEGEDNKTIIFLNRWILNTNLSDSGFKPNEIANFVTVLLLANLKIFRLDSYDKIYNKYKAQFSDTKKANLFVEVLKSNSGRININDEIYPLFENINCTLQKINNALAQSHKESHKLRFSRVRWKYLMNLYSLKEALQMQDDNLQKVLEQELLEAVDKKEEDIHFINLIHVLSHEMVFKTSIDKWLKSIDVCVLADNKKYKINIIRKNLEELTTGIQQEREHEPLNANLDQYRQKKLLQMLKSTEYKREDVYAYAVETVEFYKHRTLHTKDLNEKVNLFRYYLLSVRERRYLKYWSQINKNLEKQVASKSNDTVYFLVNDFSVVCGVMALPILMEAKKRGALCLGTSPRVLDLDKTYDEELLSTAGVLNGSLDIRYNVEMHSKWNYNWKIDIENKMITANGMNIYQPIYEIVSRYQFTYFFNYQSDAWARGKTYEYIGIMDRIIKYCEEIDDWACRNNKRVRFISHAPHFPKAAAYRIYCESKGYKHDLNFIVASFGYDNYFKTKNDSKSETLAALNLTKNRYCRHAFLGTQKGFEQYYKENLSQIDDVKRKVQKYFTYQQSENVDMSEQPSKDQIMQLIKRYKENGKKIFLFNGKVVFDLGVKYTKGCVHRDMCHCITHTVEIVKQNPDALLLIKPHPHESNISLVLTEESITTFKDLIKTSLSANTIYLDREMFRLSELIPYIDLGIVWNGTSALEFAAMGIKTLVMDIWGHYDYPIGFYRVKSLAEYEKILNHIDEYAISNELRQKAILFLDYMGSDQVRIINPYTQTTSLNFHQFKSIINEEAIDKYIKHGDMRLTKLVDNIQ